MISYDPLVEGLEPVQNRGLVIGLGLTALAGAWALRRNRPYAGPALGFGPDGRAGTAAITGGSSGIGAAFGRKLAAQGYDLLLVARRAERLAALAAELNGRFGVTVETLTADLARPEDVTRAAERLERTPDLALLINNAGFGASGRFAWADWRSQSDMLQVHVVASITLARAALPGMLQRRHGGIINVASLAAFFPVPGNATYSATKAYLVTFAQALDHEVRGQGVRVQALCPGFTRTELQERAGLTAGERAAIPDFLWGSADEVVAASLAALHRHEVVCIPGFKNQVLGLLARNQATAALVNLGLDWAERFTGSTGASPERYTAGNGSAT